MTTEEIIETFIEEGVAAYKKNYKNTILYRALQRHDDFIYEGQTFNYFRELSVYKTGQWIKEILPDVSVEVNLSGNESNIQLEISDEDLRKLTTRLYSFLKKYDCIGV